jgi:hypothetical protein
MIQNEHQYKVTKAALNKFMLALEQYQPSPKLHPKDLSVNYFPI